MPSFVSTISVLSAFCYSWLRKNLAAVLVISTLLLFISKSLYNVPIGIMALIGAGYTFRHAREILRDPFTRTYVTLFLCLWLPMLIAFIDAVNYGRSAETVFPYLRFLFFGIFVLREIKITAELDKIHFVVFIITAFWCIDAVIQFLFKIDLFGYPYNPGDITGMFYPRNTIAHVTACLSPFYFESIRKRSDHLRWLWLLLLPLFAVILLSGRRAAWIMLAVSSAGYLIYLLKITGSYVKYRKRIIPLAAIIAVVCAAVIASNQPLRDRITSTMGLFSGDYKQVDLATAHRLPIWNTAVAMFKDNWINGVGPRGFRYAYRSYSGPDDFWVKLGGAQPTTQPHQIILEVLAETGVIGCLGMALFVYLFYRLIKHEKLLTSTYTGMLAILVAVFPFNSHLAFYSSYWGSMFWWLVVMAFLSGSTATSYMSSK